MQNVSVIFRATREDKITANLETKTNPDGKASLDLLEVGSHVTIQVIAGGFATYATDFDLSDQGKEILVKMERPREQVSHYGDNKDKPSPLQPGVQERGKPVSPPFSPVPASPPPVPPATPLPTAIPQATPPLDTPPPSQPQ